jgi:hypothetical protein
MNRPLSMLAALLVVASTTAALGAGGASATPLGGINIPGLRDNSRPSDADHVIAEAKRLHARIVRTDLPWSVLEPTGPTLDPQALLYTDRLLADAKAAGIAVSATVASTPCWESSAPAALVAECRTGHGDGAESWQPKDPASYGQVVGALAQRYGDELYAIEVWNEPDQANEDYWAGPGKAAHYAQMLRAAYPAIKAAAPQINVLAGSLVGSNGGFLKALYTAGVKGYYDGLSVHYYNLTLGSLRAIRETQTANGDAKPLWLDEFGWTSCWPAHRVQQEQACVTRATQAQNLRNSIREMSRVPYIAAEEVYKLQDSAGEDFGALSGSGAHKPSYAALSEAFQHPTGPFSRITLSLRRHGSRVTASGSGPVGDFMQMEVFVGGKLRFRALFIQDRFNRYSLALPSVLGTRALRARVYQYWTGPSLAATASL